MLDISNKVVYQIYPKSFNDSNGDGWGDLPGITQKLDYLKRLGVDYLWITPFFVSPQKDNGYDVADYRSIDPRFGTMEEFEELSREAHARGIGLMLDMVFNHVSSEHEWFQRAIAGDKRYQDYFIFEEGTPRELPCNWDSKFGGPCWTWEPHVGKWYLHIFDPGQPDLNWKNPEVRHEVADVLRFWREKGVDGFRFDVINLIDKPDSWEDDHEGDGRRFYTDGARVHGYIQELVREGGIGGMMTVGEMNSTSLSACIRYTRPQNHELAMTFNFHHLKVDFEDGQKWVNKAPDFALLQKTLSTWQEGMQAGGGWNAVFWDNHDQPRALSRFATDGKQRVPAAKMLALFMDLMRGTPYIYQGDELGSTNAHFASIDEFNDIESRNYYQILVERGKTPEEALEIINMHSRDNGRLPMQWDDEVNHGFSTAEPWVPMACDAKDCSQDEITAALEVGVSGSIFEFYRQVNELRHGLPVVATGKVRFLDADSAPVLAYGRFGSLPVGDPYDASEATVEDMSASGSMLVVANFSDGTSEVGAEVQELLAQGEWDVLLCSHGNVEGLQTLRPFEGYALIRK